jgi:hypothetical protein
MTGQFVIGSGPPPPRRKSVRLQRAEERVAALEADLAAAKFAEREWHDKALELLAEREEAPNRPTD